MFSFCPRLVLHSFIVDIKEVILFLPILCACGTQRWYCFFNKKLYLHLSYYFLYSCEHLYVQNVKMWTHSCSQYALFLFSMKLYKIKTCFLFINFYWKNKVFVEQWKFNISLKQSWFLWRTANATQNKEVCVFLCRVLYPRNPSGICPESGRKQLARQGCKSAAGLGIVNLGYFSLLIILYKHTHTHIYDLILVFKTRVAYCLFLGKSIWWMVLY